MVELDERALEPGFEILATAIHKGETGRYPEDDWRLFKRAIEAYEAAKWRPIEELPSAARIGELDVVVYYQGKFHVGRDIAVVRNALFRTIDPPKQDAVSRAVSAPPAAEASS